ncbi:hypothetical protein F4678DRAFT_482369 [Xylaria arbuscula]|nr:hypothetical protein F4678DRAFT_482369 [Xylaria arbuscula]
MSSLQLSTYSHELSQNSFVAPPAWRSIRDHHYQIEEAATRLNAAVTKTPEQPEEEPHPSSAIESLPEEVLVAIMEYLDYGSLYRLSQTTGYFLRLSFDIIFELDASWRTFRHTVDRLSDGPKRRVLDGAQLSRDALALILAPGMDDTSELVKDLSETSGAVSFEVEDEGEGETMLEFMARES